MFSRGQMVGKYRVQAPLGSGGFGTVFLAEDTWIDKKVALKVPHKQGLDVEELLHEPRLLASLSHPNIVSVVTAERHDGVFFIVMEYVPGDTLETVVAREGALALPRALDFICQIGNGLEHAHRHGVLHRDLRPGNVLVGPGGVVKVADFGTSRFLEIAAHGTTVIGSPPYMAPEQFYGKAVFASDVYSLGVTMFELLTGELPYGAPTPADIERLLRGELLVSPRARNPKVPRAIADIVLKAMAPDVSQRYARAGDVLQAVLDARDEGPQVRRPASAPQRTVSRTPARLMPADPTRSRDASSPRFCWKCAKPLHARPGATCPFCGEPQ